MPDTEAQAEETIEITTLLGRGAHFEGKLTFSGTVRIDGSISGEIHSEDILVVGEGGHARAEIDVGALIVEGTIEGTIRAKRSVEIHAPGCVRGNIYTPSLFIDRGVVFEGACYMTDGDIPGDQPREEQSSGPDTPGTEPAPPSPG